MAYANELRLSFYAAMTSNDFAANLYDIEVTFVTEAYGIGSYSNVGLLKSQISDRPGQYSVRPIGLDLSRSSDSDTALFPPDVQFT